MKFRNVFRIPQQFGAWPLLQLKRSDITDSVTVTFPIHRSGDSALDLGVNPRLAFIVRQALDDARQSWDLPPAWQNGAAEYCRNVKIVVSGGFNVEKIAGFERLGVPVDAYGVGSSLFSNDGPTNTDFTADVLRVKVNGEWLENSKVGRRAGENPELEKVA